jgi:hypothetical protein
VELEGDPPAWLVEERGVLRDRPDPGEVPVVEGSCGVAAY